MSAARWAELEARYSFPEVWERALRWEALARQLGDALANWEDPRRLAPGGSYADAVETAAFDMRAALSVYRDAIKEDER